jgi:hypothetical protein
VTENEQARHLAARQKRAEQIISEARRFKVCEQCSSIFYKSAHVCSVCGAYRFSDDPEVICQTAREMGANPFPTTTATVPRPGTAES